MTTPDESTAPTRVCRRCSVQSTATGDFCPLCGASYTRRVRRPSRRRVVVAAVVVLLIAAATTGYGLKRQHDAQERDRVAAAERRAAAERAEEAEARQEAADETERESRRKLVKALEKRVTKHARGLVKDGLLDGPIKFSSCTATGGGSTDDLTALTGTFECLAVNKENKDSTMSGYGYRGTAEWDTGALTWQLGN